MRRTFILAALAAAAIAVLASVATAGAAPKARPTAKVIGNVKINKDGTGTVKARYLCPPSQDWHLWVSAKQVAGGVRDPALEQEDSSAIADTWLQSHVGKFTCDGKWHTDKFTIDTLEQGFGELEKGQAWVQFCLIGETTFLSESRWVAVR